MHDVRVSFRGGRITPWRSQLFHLHRSLTPKHDCHDIHYTYVMVKREIYICQITTEQTWAIRHAVLWPDKPLSFNQFPEDDCSYARHFGAFVRSHDDSQPDTHIGVATLYLSTEHESPRSTPTNASYLRQVAICPEWQGAGIGSMILQATFRVARSHEMGSTWCRAREETLRFYEDNGMRREGSPFEIPGHEGRLYRIMRIRF